jgi:drug/metabolite transporter (DMT)-like permease
VAAARRLVKLTVRTRPARSQPPFLFASAGQGPGADAGARLVGAAVGIAAAVMSSGSYLAIRKLGSLEPAPVVAMAFHTATLGLSVGPLALGWPQRPVLPGARDCGLLLGVAVTSFFAQLLLTRSLQRSAAALVSGISFSQVCPRAGGQRARLRGQSCCLLGARLPKGTT